MHNFGVHVRTRYSYMLEYNLRAIPHTEFKIQGGTADHTHYNLMGFSTTKTTGRYLGFGISFVSHNYFKPVKSYRLKHGLIVSYSSGQGTLNFAGQEVYEGLFYQNLEAQVTEQNVRYSYSELRIGYEILFDRVVRFDIYPFQLTRHTLKEEAFLNHQYIPAIGITKNGPFNPGFGIHIAINQLKSKK